MGFWSKNKVKDTESARNIPREQTQTQQKSNLQESSLVTIPSEDYEVIENEELNKKEPAESQLPPLPDSKNTLRFADEELELEKKLEKLREERNRLEEEEKLKIQEELPENENLNYSPQVIYLNDAECLREILRKLDYLILEVNNLKLSK